MAQLRKDVRGVKKKQTQKLGRGVFFHEIIVYNFRATQNKPEDVWKFFQVLGYAGCVISRAQFPKLNISP